jgi:hypothetical protein
MLIRPPNFFVATFFHRPLTSSPPATLVMLHVRSHLQLMRHASLLCRTLTLQSCTHAASATSTVCAPTTAAVRHHQPIDAQSPVPVRSVASSYAFSTRISCHSHSRTHTSHRFASTTAESRKTKNDEVREHALLATVRCHSSRPVLTCAYVWVCWLHAAHPIEILVQSLRLQSCDLRSTECR